MAVQKELNIKSVRVAVIVSASSNYNRMAEPATQLKSEGKASRTTVTKYQTAGTWQMHAPPLALSTSTRPETADLIVFDNTARLSW